MKLASCVTDNKSGESTSTMGFGMAKKRNRVGIAQGEEVVAELEKYYRVGQAINAEVEKLLIRGTVTKTRTGKVRMSEKVREDLCSRFRISPDQLYKTCSFAKAYTEAEFQRLCGKRHGETLAPLHWSHVRRLLVFKRTQQHLSIRNNLQKEAAENSWSVKRLVDEIETALEGKQKEGGGPRFKYTDLLRWASETERYLAGLFEDDDPDANDGRLVIDRVLADSREGRRGLIKLSELAGSISEQAQRLAERSGRQRRSRRRKP